MTPKEKAEELVEKYNRCVAFKAAIKRCALIAVDEILNSHKDCILSKDISLKYDDFFEYYEQVKQEIKKL